jgi:DNA-binding transcriptional regulator/RsmH inhibitor MraZ
VDQTDGQLAIAAEPPLGIFEAKCDEKGRVKLPVRFAAYLKALEDKVFITTLDTRIARIYPKKVWESNQNLFDDAGEDAESAEDIAFIANVYGDYSEVDDNGRVLMPTDLRRKLEIEKQSVWLDFYRGRINVFPKKIYEERMQRAMVNLGDKLRNLEKKGLK